MRRLVFPQHVIAAEVQPVELQFVTSENYVGDHLPTAFFIKWRIKEFDQPQEYPTIAFVQQNSSVFPEWEHSWLSKCTEDLVS